MSYVRLCVLLPIVFFVLGTSLGIYFWKIIYENIFGTDFHAIVLSLGKPRKKNSVGSEPERVSYACFRVLLLIVFGVLGTSLGIYFLKIIYVNIFWN